MSGKNGMSKLPRDLEVSMKSGAIMSTPPTEWGQIGPVCSHARVRSTAGPNTGK